MGKEVMSVLVVEPCKKPYVKEIEKGLCPLQREVNGLIQAIYPFEDAVAVIRNDKGKLLNMPPNRTLRDGQGEIYDVIYGPFLMTGLGEESFASLSLEMTKKYSGYYHTPEVFRRMGDGVTAFAVAEEKIRFIDVYQLKQEEAFQADIFLPLEQLRKKGGAVFVEKYNCVYSAPLLPGETLEQIYVWFNIDRPRDFTGHSLSVSDVLVIRSGQKCQAYYCDRIGFVEIPDFIGLQEKE